MAGGKTVPTCRFWQLWALWYSQAEADVQERQRKAAERKASRRRGGLRAV